MKREIFRKKRLLIFILCIIFFGIAIYFYVGEYFMYKYRSHKKQWYDTEKIVVHALGEIDDTTYTNSKEALENSYQKGARFMECDFSITADNQLVACHDWDFWYRGQNSVENGTGGYIPDFAEFMSKSVKGHCIAMEGAPIRGDFTALSGEDLIIYMKEHPDLYIITDTKDGNSDTLDVPFKLLVELAEINDCEEVLQRFIVQIYHKPMYEIVKKIYPFQNYIFTLYQEPFDGSEDMMEEYAKFCMIHNIDVITMWEDLYSDKLSDIAERYNIQLFVHTVNDKEQVNGLLEKNVGVYTDIPDFSGY